MRMVVRSQKLCVAALLILILVVAYLIGQFIVLPRTNQKNIADENREYTEVALQKTELEWINQEKTEDNPWGFNAGIIDTEEDKRAIFLTPNTGVEIKIYVQEDTLDLDYYVHPWVSEVSDGLEMSVKINGEEQFYTIADDQVSEVQKLVIDVTEYINTEIVIEIKNVNREDADLSGDWLIVVGE